MLVWPFCNGFVTCFVCDVKQGLYESYLKLCSVTKCKCNLALSDINPDKQCCYYYTNVGAAILDLGVWAVGVPWSFRVGNLT